MAFLVCTCIDPVSKFLGLIPLRCAMLIMAGIIFICGAYTFFESEIFFKDEKMFGVISNTLFALIEGAVALMVFLDFFVKKKCYTLLLYLNTLGLAGVNLAYNIIKVSIMNYKLNNYKVEHKFIQFMFMIRVGTEFVIQMAVCYYVYSYKKQL